jgi:murein DD-endopeptidase MepM/ murein hydrolase activator NlpD
MRAKTCERGDSMRASQWFQAQGYKVTSPFGPRPDPFGSGKTDFHTGIDFGGHPVGEPITTPTGGIVTHAKSYSGWGNLVAVQDRRQHRHLFAHLNKIRVKVGDRVSRGDTVGDNGKTGPATGPHLHYQVNRPDGGVRGDGYCGNPDDYIYWEDELVDKLIVIHGEGDRGMGSLVEYIEKAPVIQRANAPKELLDSVETIIQVGGTKPIRPDGIIHLAGDNRVETAEAVMRYLKGK